MSNITSYLLKNWNIESLSSTQNKHKKVEKLIALKHAVAENLVISIYTGSAPTAGEAEEIKPHHKVAEKTR
jgi:hypothetical protein